MRLPARICTGWGRSPDSRWHEVQGFNPDVVPYPFDPDRAKALLRDAGDGGGLSLRFAVDAGQYAGDEILYNAVRASLSRIGVDVDLVFMPENAWREAIQSGDWPADIDGFSLAFDASRTRDVQSALETYSCLKLIPFYCDQEITAQILAVAETMGVERRLKKLTDLASACHEAAPALYLTDAVELYGLSRAVEGFAVANGVSVYENLKPEWPPVKPSQP